MDSRAPLVPPLREGLFDRIYSGHRRAVHAFLLGRTGDPEAALDLLQETFVRVWHHLDTVAAIEPDRRRYWIFAIARNVATDHFRQASVRNAAEAKILRDADRNPRRSEDPAALLEASERLRDLDRAIGTLPEDLREPLVMQVLGGMTSAEIAKALGAPAGTIRYRISNARKRLAEIVRLHDDPDPKENSADE